MTFGPRYALSGAEKDALLDEQSDLIDALSEQIAAQRRRISELEAALSQPKKTSRNSSKPPSSDGADAPGWSQSRKSARKKKPRPSRPGVSRRLARQADEMVQMLAQSCEKCGADVSS